MAASLRHVCDMCMSVTRPRRVHRLAEAGIATTLIADGAIFAMMARVNKVMLTAMRRMTIT